MCRELRLGPGDGSVLDCSGVLRLGPLGENSGHPEPASLKIMDTLSVEQLRERLLRGDELLLVNVLPKKSFDKLHIRGSVSVSQYDEDFLEGIAERVHGEECCVVLYCNSAGCNASSKAAEKLQQAGYTSVFELEGGLAAWRAAGYPLTGA